MLPKIAAPATPLGPLTAFGIAVLLSVGLTGSLSAAVAEPLDVLPSGLEAAPGLPEPGTVWDGVETTESPTVAAVTETVWNPEIEPSRVLLSYAGGLPDATPDYISELGGAVESATPEIGLLVVTIDPAASLALIERALQDPRVASADHDRYVYPTYTPSDDLWVLEWGDKAVNLPDAWDITLGSHSIDIYILDTGIDVTHVDLINNVCSLGADMITVAAAPGMESGFHGTHVAGIAAAQIDNLGLVVGASQSCLHPVRVLAAQSGLVSWVITGMVWSANNGAEIISMSLGASAGTPQLKAAVDYAWGQGVLVVAAAGNDNCGPVSYPANYAAALAVAALQTATSQASYSNCGSQVDIAAPGSGIWSTTPAQTYAPLDGTSMATPLVSGIAALAWSVDPTLTNVEIRCILENTAFDLGTTGKDNTFGWGRVDAYDAVVAASNPASVGC